MIRKRNLAAIIVLISPSLAYAQECFQWREELTTAEPGDRRYESVVFDSIRNQTVLVGGYHYTDPNETWGWDGKDWSLLALGGIPGRSFASGAFDSDRGVMVVFGGLGLDNTAHGPPHGDTWEWDGNAWYQRAGSGPLPRFGHCMAYDSRRNVTVMFGGYGLLDGSYILLGATWEWDGTTWTLVNGEGPPARSQFACTYDSHRGVFVIFGGIGDPGGTQFLGDTWEWNGQSWSFGTQYGPTRRAFSALGFDQVRGVSVLHGGMNDEEYQYSTLGDTLEWNGLEWEQIPVPEIPHSYHSMVYDSARRRMVVLGGVLTEDKLFELIRVDEGSDADGDCDSDLFDYAQFQVCAGEGLPENGCGNFDRNQDGVVDAYDLAAILISYSGPME